MKLRICYLQVKKKTTGRSIFDSECKTINLKLSEFLPFASDYEELILLVTVDEAKGIAMEESQTFKSLICSLPITLPV